MSDKEIFTRREVIYNLAKAAELVETSDQAVGLLRKHGEGGTCKVTKKRMIEIIHLPDDYVYSTKELEEIKSILFCTAARERFHALVNEEAAKANKKKLH